MEVIDKKDIEKLAKLMFKFNLYYNDVIYLFSSQEYTPINLVLNPLVQELKDFFTECSKNEISSFIEPLHYYSKSLITRGKGDEIDFETLALVFISEEVFKVKFPIKRIVDFNLNESEVLKIYPELEERIDKYGLIKLTDDLTIKDYGIQYKNHVLYFHQFLRRGYSGNINRDFIIPFLKYYYKTKNANEFWIAIDHNRLCPIEHLHQIREFDTWFGPKFDKNALDDPKKIGLTVVGRDKNSSILSSSKELDRTEFLWTFGKGIKTFQIEEISKVECKFENYHLNKYIHAERDIDKKILRHFDGAVKIYLKDYKERFDINLSNKAKSDTKVKLFRIDGDLDIDIWIELISLFYKGNEMIIEYFDPELYNEKYTQLKI